MFKKGLAIIAIPFLFQIAFVVALFALQRDSNEARWWAIHTKEVIAKVEAVSRALAEAQGAVRGLLLTRDPGMSADYAKAVAEIPVLVLDLQKLVEDNKKLQLPRAHALSREIARYLTKLDQIHTLARSDREADALTAFQADDRQQTLKTIHDNLAVFLATELAFDRQRTNREQVVLRRQYLSIVVAAILSVVVAVTMLRMFSRGFTQRIDILSENARRLAEGQPLADRVSGLDEIGQLDAAFHGMARSLAEKDTENEMFIYSVSHDLRSPLVNLQGFARELALTADDLRVALADAPLSEKTRSKVETLLTTDTATAIHFIQTAVTRLSSIIDSLLRLSRAGRVVVVREPVDVQDVVNRVVESLAGTTSERGVDMVVNDLPPALGDTTATEQVFANLVGNAVKYLDSMRPGKIEVGVAADSPNGPVSHPGMRTYYVKDNGLGIPPAYHSKLFLAFQRLHPAVASGEGIGLALVRRMVERQGGRVWVDSAEGRGSTFFVSLPALPPDQELLPSVNGQGPSYS